MSKKTLCQALACLLPLAAGPAAPHELASYKLASDQFTELAARAKPQRRMPSRAQPGAAQALAVMSDHRRFFGAQTYSAADLEALMETCNIANRSSVAYLLFDLDAHVDPSMKDEVAKVMAITLQVASGNVIKYQDEMVPLLVFQQHCFGTLLPLLTAFVTGLPPGQMSGTRLAGLAQMRRGVLSSYLGAARTASETVVSAANRHLLFESLAQMSPLYAQALDLPARRQVRDHFQALQATVPVEFQGYVKRIGTAMASPECSGMCLL